MRKIVSLLILFTLTFSIQAKKANAIWYFLAKKQNTVSQDSNINLQYGIYTKYANEDYGQVPYPTMRIKVTNKTDKIIFIDLGTSYLKKNDIAYAIFTPTIKSATARQSVGIGVNAGAIANAVGIGGLVGTAANGINIGGNKGSSVTTTTYAQRMVSVPPKSSVFLEDIPILTPESQKALGNLFYFKEVGIGKQKWTACISPKFKDVESGNTIEYSEDNTLFTIGCYLNYSFSENFAMSQGLETTYYVKKLIGSSWSYSFGVVSNKEFNIMDKTFPQWRDEINTGNLELIRLWAR